RKRTIDAKNNTVSLHFTKSIIIPACSSKRVEFVADMASGAASSGEHRLSIKTAVDIVTNAKKIQTSYPIRGGEFTVAAVTTGTANLEYRTVSPSEVKVGDKSVALGKLSLSSNSLESHTLVNVMFKQDGSLKAGDIENIRIRRTNGEVLSNSIKKMTTDYVLLTFSSPLILKQGDNISLELIADIIGGAGRTIQFMVEEDSDFFVKGSAYGQNNNYGSRVSVSPKTTPALVAVDAGGFVLETDGPSQQNYANDTRGALLANIMMTSGDEPASIRSMYILVQAQTVAGLGMGSGSGADDEISELVKNIRLRNSSKGTSVSGVRLSGANDSLASTQKTYQIYRFDNFNVRGKENWMLEVDFINNGTSRHPLSGDKFRVHICGEPTQIKSTNGTFPTTNTTGCDFAGLLSSRSTAYQMRIEGLSTGDTITDVRPRGSISGNFHSIALAALTISQQSAGTSDITVRGAKDVSLMRYEVRAGSTKDILLTRLSFEAVAGSLQNGQNYTLWVDTNNDSKVDTVLQSGAAPQGNILTFSKLSGGGYVVKASKMTVFELHSNITSSPLSNSLQVGFASGVSNYIEAEQIDGSTLSGIRTNGSCIDTCDISITTNNSLLWTILSQGNLFVGQSTTPIRRMQILGGELSDPILRLVFRADNEPIDVTDIQIISAQSKASSIERLELFKNDAVTPFAIATTSGCGNSNVISTHNGIPVSTFCAKMNSQQFVVQPSADSTVLVRTRVKTDTNGGIPNDIIQLWVAGQTSGNIQSIKGRGTASSTNLIVNNGDNSGQGEIIIGRNSFGANADITGPEHRVVMSKINSIVNASIDSNNTAIPVGTSDIGQFAFTAAQNSNSKNGNNEVAIDNIIFTVNSSNVAIDAESLRIVRQGDSSIEHPCDAIASDGTALSGTINGIFLASCSDLISSAFSERIAKNSTAVFALRANVTNPSLGKSSTLQVSLQNYSDAT
ncbi:hypothetical protein KKG16_04165, partial [Patescibacteria group bacterium]|nr:hypothetical protein [Patescibacteria group bacterium]